MSLPLDGRSQHFSKGEGGLKYTSILKFGYIKSVCNTSYVFTIQKLNVLELVLLVLIVMV